MLNATNNPSMLSVILLGVILLSVIMLNVFMLSVVTASLPPSYIGRDLYISVVLSGAQVSSGLTPRKV
jgi:hypothetical protein